MPALGGVGSFRGAGRGGSHDEKDPSLPLSLTGLTLSMAWFTALLSGLPLEGAQPQGDQLELFCHKPVAEESQRA